MESTQALLQFLRDWKEAKALGRALPDFSEWLGLTTFINCKCYFANYPELMHVTILDLYVNEDRPFIVFRYPDSPIVSRVIFAPYCWLEHEIEGCDYLWIE